MTNTTELAQREKFEAWLSEKPLHARYMHWSNTLNAYDYTGIQLAWQAYQAGGAELVEALEKAKGMEAYWKVQCRGITDHCEELQARIAELESRTVKMPVPYAYLRENDGQIQISIGAERPSDRSGGYATPWFAIYTAAGIKVEADSLDADVNDRNQPGMVVAVHIDVGDFVKFRGQVYEVKETDFDDHDVTLWFVCGEVLKCAAGCQIEVVSAPGKDE